MSRQEDVRRALALRREARAAAAAAVRERTGEAEPEVTMYVFPRRIKDGGTVRYVRSSVFVCQDSQTMERLRDQFGTDILFASSETMSELDARYDKAMEHYLDRLAGTDRDVVLTGGRPEKVVLYDHEGEYVTQEAVHAFIEQVNENLARSARYEAREEFSHLKSWALEMKREFQTRKIGWRERDSRTDEYRSDCFPFIRDGWFIDVSPETDSVRICRQVDSVGVMTLEEYIPNYRTVGESDRFLVAFDGGKDFTPVSEGDAKESLSGIVFSQTNVERCKTALKAAGLYFKKDNSAEKSAHNILSL